MAAKYESRKNDLPRFYFTGNQESSPFKNEEHRLINLLVSLTKYFGGPTGQRVDVYETRVAKELEWALDHIDRRDKGFIPEGF